MGQVLFHRGVGVVDDGEEHVEEDEKHEEDVEEEKDWAVDAVGILQFVKLEVPEDNAQQGEGRLTHVAVTFQLWGKKHFLDTKIFFS